MYSFDAAAITGARLASAASATGRFVVSPVVWWLGVTSLFTDISSEMVFSALPAYLVLHIGLSPFHFGLIDSSYHGTTALLRVLSALFTDRLRRYKEIAGAGYGLSAVAKLVLLLGASWPVVAAGVAVDRVGKGIRTAPRDALISIGSRSSDLGVSFGVHRAMDAFGAMLGPLVAFSLLAVPGGGFDALFLTSFCMAAIGLSALVLFVRNPAAASSRGAALFAVPQLSAVLRNRPFMALAAVAAVVGVVTVSDGFLLLLVQRRLKLPYSWFPLLAFGVALVYMLTAIPLGRLADRTARGLVFVGGHVAMLVLYGCLLLLPDEGVPVGVACLALLGLYYAGTDGVLVAMASAVLDRKVLTTGLAVLGTIVNLSRVFASLAFGAAWSSFGEEAAVGAFGIGLVLSAGMAVPLLAIGRPRHA